MSKQTMPAELIRALCGNLWHATDHGRVESILQTGITATAAADWESGRSRGMGGVSLFDFRALTPDSLTQETERNPDWSSWLNGSNGGLRCGVWLRLDPDRLPGDLLKPARLWQEHMRAAESGDVSKNPIPKLEACHVGTIPPGALVSAVIVCKREPSNWRVVEPLADLPNALAEFLPSCIDQWRDPREEISHQEAAQKICANIPPGGADITEILKEARQRVGR